MIYRLVELRSALDRKREESTVPSKTTVKATELTYSEGLKQYDVFGGKRSLRVKWHKFDEVKTRVIEYKRLGTQTCSVNRRENSFYLTHSPSAPNPNFPQQATSHLLPFRSRTRGKKRICTVGFSAA